jgi:hypothetical protein
MPPVFPHARSNRHRRERQGIILFTADKYLRWSEEAEIHAAGIGDIWAKGLWREIASAYRELAQTELERATNGTEKIEIDSGARNGRSIG